MARKHCPHNPHTNGDRTLELARLLVELVTLLLRLRQYKWRQLREAYRTLTNLLRDEQPVRRPRRKR